MLGPHLSGRYFYRLALKLGRYKRSASLSVPSESARTYHRVPYFQTLIGFTADAEKLGLPVYPLGYALHRGDDPRSSARKSIDNHGEKPEWRR
jgi:hypothetical protein